MFHVVCTVLRSTLFSTNISVFNFWQFLEPPLVFFVVLSSSTALSSFDWTAMLLSLVLFVQICSCAYHSCLFLLYYPFFWLEVKLNEEQKENNTNYANLQQSTVRVVLLVVFCPLSQLAVGHVAHTFPNSGLADLPILFC